MFPIEPRLAAPPRVHDTVILRTIVGFTVLATMMPVRAQAQIRVAGASGPPPFAAVDRAGLCGPRLREHDSFVARIAAALALPEKPQAEQALRAMEPEARQAVNDAPGDPDALYNLAIVIGARADMTKSRTRARSAAHGECGRTLDPYADPRA